MGLVYDQKNVDRVAREVRERTNAMAVLVTKVEPERQLILGNIGMDLAPEYSFRMPIEMSICQHVKAMDFPLMIEDVLTHPLLSDQPMIATLGILSYIGAPYRAADGAPIGAVCALERSRRVWTDVDLGHVVAGAKQLDGMFAADTPL